MKAALSTVHWALIAALAAHGMLPAAVLCVEASGQVRVETITVRCCSGEGATPDRVGGVEVLAPPESHADDSCGPCTDSPIHPRGITKRVSNPVVSVMALPGSSLALDTAAVPTPFHSPGGSVVTDAALTPIRTTILLI